MKLCKSRGIIDGSVHEFIGEKLITSDRIIEIDHQIKHIPLSGHGIVYEMVILNILLW